MRGTTTSRLAFCLLLPTLTLSVPAASEVAAQEPFQARCGAGVHLEERSGWVWVPQGRIFCPLVADPKAGGSFISYLRGDFATIGDPDGGLETNTGSVGLGDRFAIFRVAGAHPGNGLQLDLSGAVFSQFHLDQPSFDLINADYLVGLPLTLRRDGFSTRLRVYHQSSHLGDEFLLNRQPERINLSFESLVLIVSQEWGPLRMYGGGEEFFRTEPADLAARLVHLGVELRPLTFTNGRLFAALDFKSVEEDERWIAAWSARAGLEIARIPSVGHPPRIVSFRLELYDGAAPYGQFYREDIHYWGFGISIAR